MTANGDAAKQPNDEQPTPAAPDTRLNRRRVRVWFGEHVVANYEAEPELAERYASAMSRRYAGLRVTNDPMPTGLDRHEPLPGERMWDVGPK